MSSQGSFHKLPTPLFSLILHPCKPDTTIRYKLFEYIIRKYFVCTVYIFICSVTDIWKLPIPNEGAKFMQFSHNAIQTILLAHRKTFRLYRTIPKNFLMRYSSSFFFYRVVVRERAAWISSPTIWIGNFSVSVMYNNENYKDTMRYKWSTF